MFVDISDRESNEITWRRSSNKVERFMALDACAVNTNVPTN